MSYQSGPDGVPCARSRVFMFKGLGHSHQDSGAFTTFWKLQCIGVFTQQTVHTLIISHNNYFHTSEGFPYDHNIIIKPILQPSLEIAGHFDFTFVFQ